MSLIDDVFAIKGIKRAWPAQDGIAVELTDRLGRLRAGLATEDGVALSIFGRDPVLGCIPVEPGTLVVHRFRRRAVVVGSDRVTKYVRKGGERIARANVLAGRAFRSWGLSPASVTAWTPTSVSFNLLPGRSFADLGDEALPGWRHLAQSWQASKESEFAQHTGFHEARVLARWLEQAWAFETIPQYPRIARAVLDLCTDLVEPGDTPLVVSHADLHDGQLLWNGTSVGVLDLDGARMAEAALDITNLRAHAELHHVRGFLSAHALDTIVGYLDDLASRMPTTSARLNAYLAASRMRLVFVHSFRPGCREWMERWTDHALSSITTRN